MCGLTKSIAEFYEVKKGTGKFFAACKACTVKQQKARRDADPAAFAVWRRAYQAAHRDYYRAANKASYLKHKQKRLAAQRQYYAHLMATDPERCRRMKSAWRLKNPDKFRAACEAWWAAHPEVKERSARHGNWARKARLRAAYVEKLSILTIGDRDAWVCGLCNTPVDRVLIELRRLNPTLRFIPDYPTLDHIQPFSRAGDGCRVPAGSTACPHGLKGGAHEADNVQLAHSGCNTRKWANLAWAPDVVHAP